MNTRNGSRRQYHAEPGNGLSSGVRIPEGNLGIEFDAVHWFRTAIRENAKWRLEENMKEVPDLKEKLLDDVKNYPEDGRNFFEKLVGERPALPEVGPLAELMEKQKEYDERAREIQIYRTEQVNLKVGRPSVTIHDAVEVQKQTTARIKELTGKIEELEAQQRKLQHEYPLVVMMQKNAWYDRDSLEKEIEDSIKKIIAAQDKVYRKIMDGSFPIWQMTPVVMDVLGVEGLTDGDRQEIYGWLSEQQWKAEIRDVLLNVLPIGLTIACFFIPGGASVSLLVLKRGVQAGLGIVNMYAAGEAFSRAFDMKNVVYAQSTRPDLRLTDAVISDADREVVMGFVNLMMAMVNIADVVIASKLLGKFMSLGPELRRTLNGLGPKGVTLINDFQADEITRIGRMNRGEDILTILDGDGLRKLVSLSNEDIATINKLDIFALNDAPRSWKVLEKYNALPVSAKKVVINLEDGAKRLVLLERFEASELSKIGEFSCADDLIRRLDENSLRRLAASNTDEIIAFNKLRNVDEVITIHEGRFIEIRNEGPINQGEVTRMEFDPAVKIIKKSEASAAVEVQNVYDGKLTRIDKVMQEELRPTLEDKINADFIFIDGPMKGQTVDFMFTTANKTPEEVEMINKFFDKNFGRNMDNIKRHFQKADIVPFDFRTLEPQHQKRLMDFLNSLPLSERAKIRILR